MPARLGGLGFVAIVEERAAAADTLFQALLHGGRIALTQRQHAAQHGEAGEDRVADAIAEEGAAWL